MVPYGVKGTIKEIYSGEFTVEDTVCVITDEKGNDIPVTMMQNGQLEKKDHIEKRKHQIHFLLQVKEL